MADHRVVMDANGPNSPPPTRALERAPEPATPPPIVIQAAAPPRSLLGSALQLLSLLVLLPLLLLLAVMTISVMSLVDLPGRLAGGAGERLGEAASEAGRALSETAQALRDATDPTRPPSGLVYDNEFASLRVLQVGERLPAADEYVLTLRSIERRAGAEIPATALYAVVHAELREPRETRLLGHVIRTDSDPHDHPMYKGESFRIGRTLYRVNWISRERGEVAIAAYREPDTVTGTLKFEYD